jgi:predicted Rossmann fold flavoprotein
MLEATKIIHWSYFIRLVFNAGFVYNATMKSYDVLIVGAGAAGLMCAITAGQRGRRVLVIDHANKPGKKILMSGGGRCNFTNINVTDQQFISHNPMFCKSALSRYSPQDFITLVKSHGIAFHEKTLGQLFCDHSSKDILNMLLAECRKVAVDICLNTSISSVRQSEHHPYCIKTEEAAFEASSLVIATGGLSIPTMGASPFGYRVAEQFDIKVWPTRAGLVPLTLRPEDKQKYAQLSGIACDCTVEVVDQLFREQMLFTHRGLSGPAMLQISSYWSPGGSVMIRLLPDMDLYNALKLAQKSQPNTTLKAFFSPLLSKRQAMLFFGEAALAKNLQDYRHAELKDLAVTLQSWQIHPNGTEGYRTAEVTLGGVDCDALSSKTFEVRHQAGLYFIGEVLDVTGWLGGYNFQWAWSSGYAAGCVV